MSFPAVRRCLNIWLFIIHVNSSDATRNISVYSDSLSTKRRIHLGVGLDWDRLFYRPEVNRTRVRLEASKSRSGSGCLVRIRVQCSVFKPARNVRSCFKRTKLCRSEHTPKKNLSLANWKLWYCYLVVPMSKHSIKVFFVIVFRQTFSDIGLF